jgi:hypothetical protein
MKLRYDELVDELRSRTTDELVDLAELARHFAIEHLRDEIRRDADLDLQDYLAGRLDKPTSSIQELRRKFEAS